MLVGGRVTCSGFTGKPIDFPKSESLKIQPKSNQEFSSVYFSPVSKTTNTIVESLMGVYYPMVVKGPPTGPDSPIPIGAKTFLLAY